MNLKILSLSPIRLISLVTQKLFNQKPNCISEWYSINVDYEDESLIPIPLGLSNYYSPKNLFLKTLTKQI